jgi:hypothetical protein
MRGWLFELSRCLSHSGLKGAHGPIQCSDEKLTSFDFVMYVLYII